MKKRILLLLLVLIMVFTMPVTANAASAKSSVNKSVKNFLSATKTLNTTKMNKHIYRKKDKFKKSELKELPNVVKYAKKHNKKMSYKITSTKVKGKNATVKVKITYVNSRPVANEFMNILFTDAYSGIDTSTVKYIDTTWGKASKKFSTLKTKTKTISISMIKDGKTWKIKKVKDDLKNIVFADFSESMDTATNDFLDAMNQ